MKCVSRWAKIASTATAMQLVANYNLFRQCVYFLMKILSSLVDQRSARNLRQYGITVNICVSTYIVDRRYEKRGWVQKTMKYSRGREYVEGFYALLCWLLSH